MQTKYNKNLRVILNFLCVWFLYLFENFLYLLKLYRTKLYNNIEILNDIIYNVWEGVTICDYNIKNVYRQSSLTHKRYIDRLCSIYIYVILIQIVNHLASSRVFHKVRLKQTWIEKEKYIGLKIVSHISLEFFYN